MTLARSYSSPNLLGKFFKVTAENGTLDFLLVNDSSVFSVNHCNFNCKICVTLRCLSYFSTVINLAKPLENEQLIRKSENL